MKAEMVIDLQFGSTGKGQFIGWLANERCLYGASFTAAASAWGPNAGHTFWDKEGVEHVHTMVPTSILCPSVRRVFIGPGSVINEKAFVAELKGIHHSLGHVFTGKRVLIHEHAAVVTKAALEHERAYNRIGSTQKGTGATAIARIDRNPEQPNCAKRLLADGPLAGLVVSAEQYEDELESEERILIEGAQGYSLSVYHGFYPYTTYRDVTPAQIAADTGIPIQCVERVWGTMRTLPIRVANRYSETGEQVGYSGPFYRDQVELDWKEDLDLEAELTTVTRLPRRIAAYSPEQTRRAMRQCRPDGVFLNFMNYVSWEHGQAIRADVNYNAALLDCGGVGWTGHGPKFGEIRKV
jgi:adenylosuccinate synthase